MERTRMAQKKGRAEKGTSAVPAWGLLSLEQQAVLYLLSLEDPWLVETFGVEKEGGEPLILAPSMSQGSRKAE